MDTLLPFTTVVRSGYSGGIAGPGGPGGGAGSGGSGSGGSGGTGGGGSIYLLTVGGWLLPERLSVFQQAADVCEYAVEMLVEIDGPVAGKAIADAGLRQLAGSYLVELIREERPHPAVSPHMRLKGGDRLVFIGGTNAVAELRAIP